MSAPFVAVSGWNQMVSAIINHLWQSTAVCGLAFVLAHCLRKYPARYRHGLWLVCSLKFILPFSMLAALGSRTTAVSAKLETPSLFLIALDAATHPYSQEIKDLAPLHVHSLQLPLVLITTVWLSGACILALVWVRRWVALCRMSANARELFEGREVEALVRASSRAGVKAHVTLLESDQALEPGVFGLGHTNLLWPSLLSRHLDDAQIEAIMCHELAHVRRKDNAIAFAHMLVSMIFWFHPALWWIQQRMMQEREQACDEAVLEVGYAAHVYAEGLLRTCEFCVAAQNPFIAGVSGVSLKERVVRIAHGTATRRLNRTMKLLLLVAGCAVLAVPVLSGRVQVIESTDFSHSPGLRFHRLLRHRPLRLGVQYRPATQDTVR